MNKKKRRKQKLEEERRKQLQATNQGGPIFDAQPGWGGRLTTWLKANFSKRVLPVMAIVIVIIGIASLLQSDDSEIKVIKVGEAEATENDFEIEPSFTQTGTLTQRVQPGDGFTILARKTISQYVSDHPEINLSKGQRMFIEDGLSKTQNGTALIVGNEVSFSEHDLIALIEDSKLLTQDELKIWEGFAIRAGI